MVDQINKITLVIEQGGFAVDSDPVTLFYLRMRASHKTLR